MKMSNHYNADCKRCPKSSPTFVLEGDGYYIKIEGGIVLCAICDKIRDEQLAKKREVTKYIKQQPTLFNTTEGQV